MHLYIARYLQASRPKESVIDRSTMLMQSKKPPTPPPPSVRTRTRLYKAINAPKPQPQLKKEAFRRSLGRTRQESISFSIAYTHAFVHRFGGFAKILEIILPLGTRVERGGRKGFIDSENGASSRGSRSIHSDGRTPRGEELLLR